jgi:hypothetical protein
MNSERGQVAAGVVQGAAAVGAHVDHEIGPVQRRGGERGGEPGGHAQRPSGGHIVGFDVDAELGEPLAQHVDGVGSVPAAVGALDLLHPREQI